MWWLKQNPEISIESRERYLVRIHFCWFFPSYKPQFLEKILQSQLTYILIIRIPLIILMYIVPFSVRVSSVNYRRLMLVKQ